MFLLRQKLLGFRTGITLKLFSWKCNCKAHKHKLQDFSSIPVDIADISSVFERLSSMVLVFSFKFSNFPLDRGANLTSKLT